MKKLLILAITLASTSAFAAPNETTKNGVYFGADLGRTTLKGTNGQQSRSNEYGLVAGFDLYTIQGIDNPTVTFAFEAGVKRFKLQKGSSNTSVNVNFVPKIYLKSNLALLGTVGYQVTNFGNLSATEDWAKNFKRSLNLGIGVEYQITPELSARLTVDQSKKSNVKQNSTFATLSYKF